MADILAEIIETTKSTVERRRSSVPQSALEGMPLFSDPRRNFEGALRGNGLRLIAEHKRRSPSKGRIREDLSLEQVVSAYAAGGASAISVLTEPDYFGGSLEDLARARAAVSLPLLRKDFIVDPYQIFEARAYGADAILLIASGLEKPQLADLHAAATEAGLAVLVEVHNRAELEKLNVDEIKLVGVNNRNLRTFDVDLGVSASVFPALPDHVVRVSESGYHSTSDIVTAVDMGADAVLVGESVMRNDDPGALIEGWLASADAASGRRRAV